MKIFFILFFLFSLFTTHISSEENTIIVDINYLVDNSKKGKVLKKEISSKRTKNQKKFQELEKSLKEKEKKLIAKKNVISEQDFAKEFEKFQNDIKKFNQDREKKVKELRKFRNDSLSKLISEINSVIVNYAKENNISLAIDKKYVLLIKSENDVTKQILDLLNK